MGKNRPTTDGLSTESEGDREIFLGEPRIELEQLYESSDRLPNVLVATDGAVLATWGGYQWPNAERGVRVRRSTDGGETWSDPIDIGAGEHGGGAIVDETTDDVLAFVDYRDDVHDPGMYRSADNGKTWESVETTFYSDKNGNTPSLHMAEHGITLRHSSHAGRLLRPARVYGNREYNTALYSDDNGETWHPSTPFPVRGTGEGAVAELTDGRIYYSSRKHHFGGQPYRDERLYAWSEDSGETWHEPTYDETLPDGPRYRSKDGRGACYNGHFGMMCGLERLRITGEDILLYSNVDNEGYQRRNLTVWGSFDGGATWPVKRRVYDRPSAYSSLAAGRPGTASEGWIYLLFEHGQMTDGKQRGDYPTLAYAGGTLAQFTLRWLARGELTGDGEPPAWVDR